MPVPSCAGGVFRYQILTGMKNVVLSAPLLVLLALVPRLEGAETSPVGPNGSTRLTASAPSGFHDLPLSVALAQPLPGAAIRYTTDGSEPTPLNGGEYRAPLPITNTTVLRAAVFRDLARVSPVLTRTYLCLEQVLRQPRNPPGYPTGATAWRGHPSSYAMDPRIVENPIYTHRLREALQSLPILSLVCRREDLFNGRAGLYLNSLQRGKNWERACAVELIPNDGSAGFQADCAIRIQGNYNRIPSKSPKHSFRLLFKAAYGEPKLRYRVFPDSPVETFDTLVLRADYNNSWTHWEGSDRLRAQRARDAWLKDSHRAMGWIAGHNRYAHLFLNGLYWGIYDIAERPDASFAAAYLGGGRGDYDVINEFQVKDGAIQGFQALQSLRDLDRDSQYQKLKRQLDVTQFIDYLLLHYYAGNMDWGENKNWYAIRRRQPPGPFQFFVWDGEQILERLNDDVVNSPREEPFHLALDLLGNVEFRAAFSERVKKHCLGGGALTPEACAARWIKRTAELDVAIVAESARWGGYRRDPPYTRDKDWIAEQQRLLKNYFPRRTAVVLGQLRAAGLYEP
jgi:hypothetical protein